MITLKQLLIKHTITHKEAAKALGVTRQSIDRWCRGTPKIPLPYLITLFLYIKFPSLYRSITKTLGGNHETKI